MRKRATTVSPNECHPFVSPRYDRRRAGDHAPLGVRRCVKGAGSCEPFWHLKPQALDPRWNLAKANDHRFAGILPIGPGCLERHTAGNAKNVPGEWHHLLAEVLEGGGRRRGGSLSAVNGETSLIPCRAKTHTHSVISLPKQGWALAGAHSALPTLLGEQHSEENAQATADSPVECLTALGKGSHCRGG